MPLVLRPVRLRRCPRPDDTTRPPGPHTGHGAHRTPGVRLRSQPLTRRSFPTSRRRGTTHVERGLHLPNGAAMRGRDKARRAEGPSVSGRVTRRARGPPPAVTHYKGPQNPTWRLPPDTS